MFAVGHRLDETLADAVCKIPPTLDNPVAVNEPRHGAMRRLGEHFYTVSDGEPDNAVATFGYITEAEPCWVFARVEAGAVSLHRLRNDVEHFYTPSVTERDAATANTGPNVPIATSIQSMQQVYDAVNIKV